MLQTLSSPWSDDQQERLDRCIFLTEPQVDELLQEQRDNFFASDAVKKSEAGDTDDPDDTAAGSANGATREGSGQKDDGKDDSQDDKSTDKGSANGGTHEDSDDKGDNGDSGTDADDSARPRKRVKRKLTSSAFLLWQKMPIKWKFDGMHSK